MPTKTYYGLLDASSNVGTAENLSNEFYRTFCTFMGHLTGSGQAVLIAWNSGTIVPSGSFSSRTYFDGSLPFGLGAHSVWKFPTSSTRNWEWYLYTQVVSGSSGAIRQTFNTPISGYASAVDAIAGSAANRGILMQAALCISGTTSFNPWSGSLNPITDGGSSTGTPRWISGALDRTLFVLPRSNDFGGTAPQCVASKSNGITMGQIILSSATTMRYHFIFDGDSLVTLTDDSSDSTYSFSYVGALELRNSLTSSGIGNGQYGFVMYSTAQPNTDTATRAADFGDLAGIAQNQNGGVAVNIQAMSTGSKTGVVNTLATFLAAAFQPNSLTGQFDEFPIYVGVNESPNIGLMGAFNSGLMRYAVDCQVHDVTGDLSRAVFGGSTTTANVKITTPWTGAFAPGVGASRTGSLFTWTRNYG